MGYKPFLSYYRENKISPVRQDISDLEKHFRRREALYRHLGIPARFIAGKRVIEFGPGGGHNALFTAACAPSRYVLVDGNPTGLESTRALLAPCRNVDLEIVESDVLQFRSDERFDLVLAEGLIQLQEDPPAFARRLGEFAAEGGVFVITTSDHISFLSETLRRVMAHALSPRHEELPRRLEKLLPVFAPHARSLPGMSRPVEDWVTDSLLIPFSGRLFSIPEALAALEDFEPYHLSPHFGTDWRWYKSITESDMGYRELFTDAYWREVHNFVDYRFVLPSRDPALNRQLYKLCETLYDLGQRFEREGSLDASFENTLAALTDNLPNPALREFLDGMKVFRMRGAFPEFVEFSSLFGRSMQYVSYIRRSVEQDISDDTNRA